MESLIWQVPPNLQQVLDQLCRDGYPEIVLDMSGLEFLGAAALAVIYLIDEQQRAVNGRLIVHRPRQLARHTLAVTGLDTVLTIQPATARSFTCDNQRGRRGVVTNVTGRIEAAGRPSARNQHLTHRQEPTMISDSAQQ